jgi:hypothetical protein
MKDFRKLKVWGKAHRITLALYRATKGLGSASELEYHLILAADLGYLEGRTGIDLGREVVEVKRMISGLLARLKADS